MNENLPKNWALAEGSDIFDIIRGVTFKKTDTLANPLDGYKAILRAGNIQKGEIILDDLVYVPSEKVKPIQSLLEGDLVIAMSSGSASLVGKVADIQCEYPEVSVGAFCGIIRPNHATFPKFLKAYFSTRHYRNLISSISVGVNINNLKPANLFALDIPVPPLNEQKRIVAKIEALQARSKKAREALADVPKQVEQFKQSVLAAAFRGDLTKAWREQNPDVEPAEQLLERIRTERRAKWEADQLATYEAKGKTPPKNWQSKYKEPAPVDTTDLPELPDGWCWESIDGLAFVTKLAGFEYTKFVNYVPDGDLAVIKAENAGKSGFKETDFSLVKKESVKQLTRSILRGNEVLVVFVGAGVGQVARVPFDREYFLGPNIAMARTNLKAMSPEYLELYLRSPLGFGLAMSFTKAVAQPSLSMTTIRLIPVALPSLAEQYQVTQRIETLFTYADSILEQTKASLKELDRLDQSILAKAFRGELVPQDPNDEPASVLLERIKAERAAATPIKRSRKKAVSC